MTGQVRIDHAVTSGTFSLDGETFQVDNNIWVVGDDDECVVIDAPHSVEDILKVVADRRVRAIVCTHAQDDHVRVAPDLSDAVNAPILLHPADKPLWDLTHTDRSWNSDLVDGQDIGVAGTRLLVLHTPGHAPGAVCIYAPDLDCVFTGDTLFDGGPGATGRSYSDLPTLEKSIRTKLLALPADTTVHTGHGNSTTIGKERAQMAAENAGRRVRMMRLPGEECVP